METIPYSGSCKNPPKTQWIPHTEGHKNSKGNGHCEKTKEGNGGEHDNNTVYTKIHNGIMKIIIIYN